MAKLSIRAFTPDAITAPAGLWFEAEGLSGFDSAEPVPGRIHDPSFHEITFRWQVTGPEMPAFTAPGNLPPVWNRPDLAFGKQVAFFLPKPGTYTITLNARDRSENTATATYVVEVIDANRLFPDARTILVSDRPDENWADTDPAWQRVSDLHLLPNALKKAGGPARLLFRRGSDMRGLSLKMKGRDLSYIGAWGEGPRPILRPAFDARPAPIFRFGKGRGSDQVTVSDIEFRSDWDSTTETGISAPSPIVWRDPKTAGHYAIWNCHFDGFAHLDVQVAKSLSSRMLVGNTSVTNWRNYGFLMRSAKARFALVGCQVAQHVEALHGGPKEKNLWNNHGPVRIPDCQSVYIAVSDFFSRTGWSPLLEERADQPCLRLNTSGTRGQAMVVERVVCEGGYQVINMAGSHPGTEENPGNYLIDRALLVAGAKTIGPFIAVDFAGLTARNVIGILPDAARRHDIRWMGGVHTRRENPGPGNTEGPMALYSSSFLNLLSPTNGFEKPWTMYQAKEPFDDLTLENNLLESAETEPVFDQSSPFPGVRTRFRGVRYNFRPVRDTLKGHVAPGESLKLPYGLITTATFADKNPGQPTDADYWLKIADVARWHVMSIEGVRRALYAAFGAFQVIVTADGLRVVNTGRKAWPDGAAFSLKLDRTPYLPEMDRRYGSREELPMPISQKAADLRGSLTEEDALLTLRGAAPSQGAIEPR